MHGDVEPRAEDVDAVDALVEAGDDAARADVVHRLMRAAVSVRVGQLERGAAARSVPTRR